MRMATFQPRSAVALRLCVLLVLANQSAIAQAPGVAPAPKQQEQLQELDRLAKQVDELRQAGKFDEAVGVAERALDLERRAGGESQARVANALSRVAELHELRGDWAGALARRKEALTVRENSDGKDHWRTVNARLALAFAEKVSRLAAADRAKAESAMRKAHEAARLLGRSNLAEAERAALEVIETLKSFVGPDTSEVARAWDLITRTREARNDVRGAKDATERALDVCRKSLPEDHPDTAQRLTNLGNLLKKLREYAAAEKAYERALAISRKLLPTKYPIILFPELNALASVQNELHHYDSACKTYEEALAIVRKFLPKDHALVASSVLNLGSARSRLGEYDAARKCDEEALEIFRKALPKYDTRIADCLNNLGLAQHYFRDDAAAKQSHEEALSIYRKAQPKNHLAIARSLWNLAVVQRRLSDYEAARQSHEEALAIRRMALGKEHPTIADSLDAVGVLQCDLRDYVAARKRYEEALAIRRMTLPKDDLLIAGSLNNIGALHYHLRDYEAARKSHEQALAIYRTAGPAGHLDLARSLNNLGEVHFALRENEEARKYYEEALAMRRRALPKDHPDIATCLQDLGALRIVSSNDPSPSLAWLTEAIDIKQQHLNRLALVQAEPEQLRAAAEVRSSLDLLLSAADLVGQGYTDLTYTRVLAVKGAITARQRWARSTRDPADPATADLLRQLRQANRDLLATSTDQDSGAERRPRDSGVGSREVSSRRGRLEQELAARSSAFRDFLAQGRCGLADVRSALPTGAAVLDFVEYIHTSPLGRAGAVPSPESRMVVFVLRPDQKRVEVVPLGSSQALARLIERWRASYGAGKAPPVGAPDPGAELRKRVWEPLAVCLGGVKVVLASPDGPLNGLPLAALPGSEAGSFLIHEYAFAVVPVLQLLPQLLRGPPQPAKTQPSVLLVGGINFGEGNARDSEARAVKPPPVPVFGPLAGTESEVNDLRSQFEDAFPDAPAPKLMRKDKATKQAILAVLPSHRFVHLATHGFFAAESEKSALSPEQRAALLPGGMRLDAEAAGRNPGLLSGMVFAGVNLPERKPEETILTALEAAEQDLGKVELVVLSACETGRGQVADGEGVLGLQRAFQIAGARSVVASLWRVPDEETHQLMREFYRRVWSDKPMSKAEALRQAQVWMLENWKPRGTLERSAPQGPPPPYYWAAFVLSGDWR